MFYPTDVDEFQAIEQNHELRQSLEEAASEELQQGWRGREEKAREDEVQAILDRPREMEEGRGSGMSSTFCGEDEDEMVMGRFGGKR